MAPASKNSFGTRGTLQVDGKSYDIFELATLTKKNVGHVDRLPFSLRVLLENLLRQEDGRFVHDPACASPLAIGTGLMRCCQCGGQGFSTLGRI